MLFYHYLLFQVVISIDAQRTGEAVFAEPGAANGRSHPGACSRYDIGGDRGDEERRLFRHPLPAAHPRGSDDMGYRIIT